MNNQPISELLSESLHKWLSEQKYGDEPLLHAAVCCDFVGIDRFKKALSLEIEKILSKKKSEKESILCAAIWINDGTKHNQQPVNIESGYVICGRRHNNCYQTIKSLTGQTPNERIGDLIKSLSEDELRKHHGFITSSDRYVDRTEGWKIAKANNQIQFGLVASENGDDSILISENLY